MAELITSSCAQPRYKDLTVPILAMHGGADKITSMPAVRRPALPDVSLPFIPPPSPPCTQARRLVNEASSTDKVFHVWEGAYHELFNEPEAGQVLDKLCTWLGDHAATGSKL
jgi:alpha-beta hydrolase superfamily lysophospholipase